MEVEQEEQRIFQATIVSSYSYIVLQLYGMQKRFYD